jgi:uncharacterized protein YajQ (UPF0234 family)
MTAISCVPRSRWEMMSQRSAFVGREPMALSSDAALSFGDFPSHSLPNRAPSAMASTASFDVSTGADLQEVDNAVNQALKEIAQRYDFKGTHCSIEFDREKGEIRLSADDEFRMEALLDVLRGRLIKRAVPVKNLQIGDLVPSTGQSVRRTVALTQGITGEVAKKIVKAIKDGGFKKVQASIQGDEVRVTSPLKDELQSVIAFLRGQEFGIELKFGNFRG